MSRTVKIVLFAGILLLGVAATAIYWTFYRPLPDYGATVPLDNLDEPVKIKWDHYGVPHIYARNKHDLYRALGYVHAQDRLWQMTVSQMAAQGRFAEFLGSELIPIDQLQRTVGFWRIARKIERQLADSTRQMLQAYADGVNQYVDRNPRALPVQFAMAGMGPIPWTPTHSLALARLMAWQLNMAWRSELVYNMIFSRLSPAQFAELFPNPAITDDLPERAPADTGRADVARPLLAHHNTYRQLMGIEGIHAGSNAWAVGGGKTGTGEALLAGDPHLPLNIPGQWYEVHLNLRDRNLSGATIPGAPSVVLGQNDVLAWSATNTMLDDTDFYEERLHPQDSSRYLLDSLGGEPVYQQFVVQREVLKVKNADDRTFTRRLTKHGPVISDIYPDQELTGGKVITMRWTGQEPSQELEALQAMGWARSMKGFRAAARGFKTPAQNFIYADTTGNIALFTAASVPVRSGNPVIFRAGWKPRLDWQRYVDGSALPAVINPGKGWVANANNPVDRSFPYYLSVYWQSDSRYERIRQYLSDNNRLSREAFQVMQTDSYSNYARELTPLVLSIINTHPDTSLATAVSYLENWDYKYTRSETAASIFDVFLLRLTANTLGDELGDALCQDFLSYSAKPARIMHDLLRNDSSFFDDITTEASEGRAQMVLKSMRQALATLRNRFGSQPAEWRWGNLHTITLRPSFFGRAAQKPDASTPLRMIVTNVLNRGPYPAPGNSMSINNGEYLWNRPYEMVVGPSIRRIVDLAKPGQSLSIMPGGQSENPLSEFYSDQTESWLNGQYKFFYQDSTRLKNPQTMRLVPRR